ncbi:MAG: DUF1847 domain-containing protein [Desulfobacteraceae bacterium]|nr:DUF1847 domain-containing protein [Desulfobacteraceae bacterium]
MSEKQVLCSYCARKNCYMGDVSQAPDFCPTVNKPEVMKEAMARLSEPQNQQMAQDVARSWKAKERPTRVERTVEYARLRGYKKLGLAFCAGLSKEAELLTNYLLNEGFETAAVCCMCGAISSDDIDLPEEDKVAPAGTRQAMCNPITQALVLNSENCDFNIILGLCVGDDTLFVKHSEAPVTLLAAKDRDLAHNPLGALYTAHYGYTRLNVRRPKK